jgi:uroporphyrinogen decarboxylase
MRQAGRYLPEYREVRAKAGSFLSLCYHPELACEVTLQPLRRFDLDAAIVFSDILVVPHAMGLSLSFVENEGPRLSTVASMDEVLSLKEVGLLDPYRKVCETLAMVRPGLERHVSLIGFCGAPWTVASYMIEGGSSARKTALDVAQSSPDWFEVLIDKLIEHSGFFLIEQIKAGAEVVQIFDSWAGDLPLELREKWVTAPIAEIVRRVRAVYPGFPVIVFARGIGGGHGSIAAATAASAVSVEQDADIGDVLRDLPSRCAVQGNLSPEVLLRGGDALVGAVRNIAGSVPMHRHVFNLGHGIVPATDPSNVGKVVEAVREFDGVGR